MSTLLSIEAGDIQATPPSSSALSYLFSCSWRQGECQTAASHFHFPVLMQHRASRRNCPIGCGTVSALQAHTHARPPAQEGQGQNQLVLSPGTESIEIHQKVSPDNRIHYFLKEESP